MNESIYLLLHNIRSVHNVGAMFRTAEASGVKKIYLSGYTPRPIDRFGRPRQDFHKSALGAENLVPWEEVSAPLILIDNLKQKGVFITALEQSPKAIDYRTIKKEKERLIIVGNEVDGVERGLLEKADTIAEIPIIGKKESLNVTTALGIFLFSLI